MTTPTAPEAQSKINAADVVAWLESFVPAEHKGNIGVTASTYYHVPFVAQVIKPRYGDNFFGETPQAAIAKCVASILTPEQIAAEKRDQIAKLQAELAAIEGKGGA